MMDGTTVYANTTACYALSVAYDSVHDVVYAACSKDIRTLFPLFSVGNEPCLHSFTCDCVQQMVCSSRSSPTRQLRT